MYMNTHMHIYMYICVCVILLLIYHFAVVGVVGPTQDVSGLCAHTHMKRFGMCWNWFILALDSQWYVSSPSSVFSDVK